MKLIDYMQNFGSFNHTNLSKDPVISKCLYISS